jgi:aryl-phospho-beta-D-glucosidase BglC (GH1 family)
LTTGFNLNRFHNSSLERTLLTILLITLSALTIYRLPAHTSSSIQTNSSATNQPPIIVGWGGVGIGESLSDIQTEMQYFAQQGYNAVRLDFEPTCTTPPDSGILGSYDQAKLGQIIALAKQYNLWVIVDYHGYTDLQTSTTEQCWLSFWQSLVQNFTSSYTRIVWEPINEPQVNAVTDLSTAYQALINEVRALGDTHWIVVQSFCSANGCPDNNMAPGYPTVTDTAGHVFISLHSYMAYQYYSSSWNNATADTLSQDFYSAVVTGMQTTGWPALNTEGGADPQMINCSGGVSLPSSQCAPDQVLVGSAGYSVTTFHFIQTLTNLYDANTPQRINWIWWPAGSWTDTPGAGVYGALQCNSNPIGWGCLLQHNPVTTQGQQQTLTGSFSLTPTTPQAGQQVTFSATASGGTPPYTYSWNLGDGATGSGQTTIHTYASAGTYNATLTITDSSGNTTSLSQTFNVAQPSQAPGTCPLCQTAQTLESNYWLLILLGSLAGLAIFSTIFRLKARSRSPQE